MNVSFDLDQGTYSVSFGGFSSADLRSFLVSHGANTIDATELARAAKDNAQRARQASRQVVKHGDCEVVTQLIEQHCQQNPGSKLLFGEVFERLAPRGWSRQRFTKALPIHFKPVRGTGGKKVILNLGWRA